MIYYVIEFQTGSTGAVLPVSYTDRNQAEAAYHTILASAAVSEVAKHGVMLCNADLFVIKSEIYIHGSDEDK